MNLLAVTSASSRRRLERARAWLEARERDEELLVVGATVDAANELARQVASRKGAAFGWHRIGLSQLVSIVAARELAHRGGVPLTRIAADAITTRLIHRLRVERKLGRYASVSETPGFPRAIAGVIAELRSAGIRSGELNAVAPDLGPIVREYERELAEGGFIDWSGTLELAMSAIARPDRHRLVGLPTLLLDVAVRTEAEFGFLSAFVSAARATLATVPAGDIETLHRFRDRLGFETRDLDPDEGEPNDALARLQRHLFTSMRSRGRSRVAMRSRYSRHRERGASASRSLAAFYLLLGKVSRSIGWPFCCGRPTSIVRISRRRFRGRESPFTLRAGP